MDRRVRYAQPWASDGRQGRIGRDVLWAALVGGVSAALTLLTRWLIIRAAALATGDGALSGVVARSSPSYDGLPIVSRLVLPAVGGLVGGLLIAKTAPETSGDGVRQTRSALAADGSIRARVLPVRAAATTLCIGSGGSAGTFGPIVHLGGAVGSTTARLLRLPPDRAPLLVAAGSAAAIASLLGAPLAGACFALEVLLLSAAPRAVLAVVTAAAVGVLVRSAAVGTQPLFDVHPGPTPAGAYLLAPILGLVCAAVAVAFVRLRAYVERVCLVAWRGPPWLLPALGGALLGPLLVAAPQLWGVGLPAVQAALVGHFTLSLLALLLVGKIVGNCLTVGTGASGGMFTPLLFSGAMLGCAVAAAATDLGLPAPTAVFGLSAMAGVAGAAAGAPLAASLLVLETTRAPSIVAPLLIVAAVSTLVVRLFQRHKGSAVNLCRRSASTPAQPKGDWVQP